MQEQTDQPTAEVPRILYDADAAQTVTVQIEDDETIWDVTLRAYPLTDELIRTYARKRDELAAGEVDAAATAEANITAAEQSFSSFIERVEMEGEAPALSDLFGAPDMHIIITELLSCRARLDAPTPKRGGALKEWQGGRKGATTRVYLQCAFNGESVDTAHVFRRTDAATYAQYARGI